MARTPSTMIPLGTPAPAFDLPDAVSGSKKRLGDFASQPLLVMFICNHCPFVHHVRDELGSLGRDYAGKLAIVAINSNDAEKYPDDSPEKMKTEAKTYGYSFPYLVDEAQDVAKAYSAACTPDFFLFSADHTLAYRGQLDDSRPGGDRPVTGKDLRAAIDAVLAGDEPNKEQRPSMGCNIKWKPGNEPVYAG